MYCLMLSVFEVMFLSWCIDSNLILTHLCFSFDAHRFVVPLWVGRSHPWAHTAWIPDEAHIHLGPTWMYTATGRWLQLCAQSSQRLQNILDMLAEGKNILALLLNQTMHMFFFNLQGSKKCKGRVITNLVHGEHTMVSQSALHNHHPRIMPKAKKSTRNKRLRDEEHHVTRVNGEPVDI